MDAVTESGCRGLLSLLLGDSPGFPEKWPCRRLEWAAGDGQGGAVGGGWPDTSRQRARCVPGCRSACWWPRRNPAQRSLTPSPGSVPVTRGTLSSQTGRPAGLEEFEGKPD